MKKNLIVLVVSLVVGFGCAGKKVNPLAPELAKKAMIAFEKKKYDSSIETFEKLLDWYPFDKLAILAEFKIAEAHFQKKEYEEAIMYYQEFKKLHPRNDSIPYVMYKIALSYYMRVDTVDRDQKNARNARSAFNSLIQQFPESEYAKKSEVYVKKTLESIAGNELYVGKFYYKSKHYKAALLRFKSIIDKYPGLGFDKQANEYIAKCNKKIAIEKAEQAADKIDGA